MESLDDLIQATGGFGRFQLYMTLVTSLPVCCAGWTIMQIQFIDVAPDFYCVINKWQNDSTINSQTFNLTTLNVCSFNGTPCDAYDFVNTWVTTVTKWDLVCDRKWIKNLLESLQLAGLLVGSLLVGQISDWYGPNKTLLAFVALTSLSNFLAAFAITLEMYGVLRIFLGIGACGIVSLLVPYTSEFLGQNWRSIAILFPAFPIGVALSVGVEFLLPNMVYVQLVGACFAVAVLPGIITMPEGLRWLTVNGHIDKAESVINKIAKLNKKSVPENTRLLLTNISKKGETLTGERRSYSILHIFVGCSSLQVTCIGGFIAFSKGLVYYGISYGISKLAGNIFLNTFLMAVCVIPANMSVVFLNNCLGRRLTVFLFTLLSTISQAGCLLILYAIPDGGRQLALLLTALSVVAIVSVDSATYAFGVWKVELYPTVVRNSGFAFLTSLYRIGGLVSPFVIDLADRKRISFIIMAALMLMSTLLTLALPETKGKDLADYMPGSNYSKPRDCSESDRLPIGNKLPRYCDDSDTQQLLNCHKN